MVLVLYFCNNQTSFAQLRLPFHGSAMDDNDLLLLSISAETAKPQPNSMHSFQIQKLPFCSEPPSTWHELHSIDTKRTLQMLVDLLQNSSTPRKTLCISRIHPTGSIAKNPKCGTRKPKSLHLQNRSACNAGASRSWLTRPCNFHFIKA